MYESYFGFKEKPFRITPDASFYFPSSEHERAMSFLQYGLELADGFIVITGDVGAGKTTLVRTLLQDLDEPGLVVANIVSSQLEDSEVLQLAAIKLGYKVKDNPNKGVLLDGLQNAFTQLGRKGGRALLIVDEAQNLSPSSLEELRMLSNFQLDGRALVQIFLVGQPEFRDTMVSPQFEQLKQRVIANHHLKPMSEDETRAYIEHRLTVAGWSGNPAFDDDVFAVAYRVTQGVPRKINNLFDRVLLSAFLEERTAIEGEHVQSIAAEIEAEFRGPLAAESAESAENDAPSQPGPAEAPQVAQAPAQPTKPSTDVAAAQPDCADSEPVTVRASADLRLVPSAPLPPEPALDEQLLDELQQELFALDTRLQMTERQIEDSKAMVRQSLARIDAARFELSKRKRS